MANVWAEQLEFKYLGREPRIMCIQKEIILEFGENLCEEIVQNYREVGDLSTHPINERLAKPSVRSIEVKWEKPPDPQLFWNIC